MRIFTLAITGLITFVSSFTLAQTTGDYRSTSGGAWTDPGIWERFNGTSWVAAPSAPSSSDGVIFIQHHITVPASQTIVADQVIMGGNLTVDATGTFSLANGDGIDLSIFGFGISLTVNGTFIRQNLSEISNPFSALIQFNSESVYEHRYTTTVGDLPAITWDPNSTLLFGGFTNTTAIEANASWNQSYGHVTFNSPGQRGVVDFAGNLTSIQGNLSVLSTGNNAVQLSNAETLNIAIGGDLIISGTARLIFGVSGTVTASIGGDINFTSTTTAATYGTFTGTTTIDLQGDFIVAASTGRFRFAAAGTTGNTTLNLHNGDFELTSGRLDEIGTTPSQGNIRFLRAGQQNFLNAGVISGYFNYYVSPQTTLDLGNSSIMGASPSAFTLDGGTLIVGSTHALGALNSSTSAGNIRTPNAFRTYAPGSTIVYRSSEPQFMGTGQPLVTDITTVIDNPSGVNLYGNRVMNHPLVLASGTLNINNYILTINSTVESTGGGLGGTPLSRLYLYGNADGPIGELPFSPGEDVLGILTFNRTGDNVSATLTQPLTIISQLNLTRGTLINNSTLTLGDSLVLTRYETAALTGNVPVTLPGEFYNVTYRTFTPAGGPFATLTGGIELPNDATRLGNLTLYTAQTGDNFQLDRNITINGILTLVRGSLLQEAYNITMNGLNWNDNAGNLVPGTGTVIFNDSTVVNGTSNPLFGNIQVNADASVNFVRNFSLQGNVNFLPGSNIETNAVTATFSGSTSQAVSANGATFTNINIAKGSGQGVTLTSQLNLTGLLQFTSPSSNVNVQSNGHLNLLSTSDGPGSGTARIYRLSAGNQISGNVVVNRFMSGEGRIYRYLSSPVSNASVADLKDDFFVGGTFADPTPTQTICGFKANSASPSLYYYDETMEGDIDAGYVAYPESGTAAGSPLVVGRGYSAFIRQCAEPTIIDFTGPINAGTLTLPVTYTNNDPGGAGWNLVGNPYPSAIDWDAGWTKTRISPVIAITDNGSAMIRYYEAGVTNDIPNGQIAIGQGFWVRATAANPLLRINETAKVTTVPEFFREAQPSIPAFYVALSNGSVEDKAYVKTVSGALNGLDEFDAPKLTNPLFNLFTVAENNVPMAINALEQLTCGMELPLGTRGLEKGNYSFRIDTRGFFSDLQFVLLDKYLSREIILDGNTYEFVINEASDNEADGRFALRIEQKTAAPVTIASASACSEKAEIVINNAARNVEYSIWTSDDSRISALFAGDGDALSLELPTESLAEGENALVIKATGSCGGYMTVSELFSLTKGLPSIETTTAFWNCSSGSALLTAVSANNGDAIRWFERENDLSPVYTGSTFETPVLSKNRTYFVEAVSIGGCVSERKPVLAEVQHVTPPALEVSGSTLVSSYESGNQWFLDGVELEGKTERTLEMTSAGQYTLSVNVKGCVTSLSYFLEESFAGIQFYPNPVAGDLHIAGITDDVLGIELASPSGLPLGTVYRKGQNFDGKVSLESLPNGVYLLIVTKAGKKDHYRIIKN